MDSLVGGEASLWLYAIGLLILGFVMILLEILMYPLSILYFVHYFYIYIAKTKYCHK